MLDNADAHNIPSSDDRCRNASADYLFRAKNACASGDTMLGMHLYLAAFEEATRLGDAPTDDVILGLKQAWSLACSHKERSLAEYVFEKLEPFLASEEIARCAECLQNLALDKLEEFGLSRQELEDMTEMISQDFLGLDTQLVKVEIERPGLAAKMVAPFSKGRESADTSGTLLPISSDSDETGDQPLAIPVKPDAPAPVSSQTDAPQENETVTIAPPLNYEELAGYGNAIAMMRNLGIGMRDDPDFQQLVSMLNARHGLDRMPAADTLLFRAPVREDANRFMEATLGELKLPVLRMRMEENLQGMPVLCVTAQAEDAQKLNPLRQALQQGGVLVLEDLDLWSSPVPEVGEDQPENFFMAQISRGAREAINLIRSSVENPEVYVLVTSSSSGEIDAFFLDILEPLTLVDIDYPDEGERHDIWSDIVRVHPSLRGVDHNDLVRLSTNLPRYDIYMAAREAIEEAYKQSLVTRAYQPVTRENIFDKLAAYQPLDSREYRELEESVIEDFRRDIAHLDDILPD